MQQIAPSKLQVTEQTSAGLCLKTEAIRICLIASNRGQTIVLIEYRDLALLTGNDSVQRIKSKIESGRNSQHSKMDAEMATKKPKADLPPPNALISDSLSHHWFLAGGFVKMITPIIGG